MKQLTQKELLNEGFWDGFKSVAKGAAKLGQQVAKVAAPEIYNPIAGAANWAKDTTKQVLQAAQTPEQNITKVLKDEGFEIIPPVSKSGENYVVRAYKITAGEDGHPEYEMNSHGQPIVIRKVVDKNGADVRQAGRQGPSALPPTQNNQAVQANPQSRIQNTQPTP